MATKVAKSLLTDVFSLIDLSAFFAVQGISHCVYKLFVFLFRVTSKRFDVVLSNRISRRETWHKPEGEEDQRWSLNRRDSRIDCHTERDSFISLFLSRCFIARLRCSFSSVFSQPCYCLDTRTRIRPQRRPSLSSLKREWNRTDLHLKNSSGMMCTHSLSTTCASLFRIVYSIPRSTGLLTW